MVFSAWNFSASFGASFGRSSAPVSGQAVYCCSQLDTLVSEVASDAGTCMLMVGGSGILRGILQQHWVALHGLLGNSERTPYALNRREAGRPVWADMALDGCFLLRRLTRTDRPSEPTQQTASLCASYAARHWPALRKLVDIRRLHPRAIRQRSSAIVIPNCRLLLKHANAQLSCIPTP